jgi:lipoprotein-releasing system permease protein
MVSFDQIVSGVVVRGILPRMEDSVADLSKMMVEGSLDNLVPGEFGIVIGTELARALGAFTGDKIVLISPQGQVTPAGILPRLKQFTVTGIFEAGQMEYDSGLVLIHLADAQKLYRMEKGQVSGVRLKLHDLFEAPQVARELVPLISEGVYITDWTRQHANYFRAIQIEKRMLSLILSLIIAVAAFNIVSTLVMAVTDKQPDIAILRTLGASPSSIMKIFIVQGTLIGVIGTMLGLISGVSLAYNVSSVIALIESLFSVRFLSPDIYLISDIPSDPQAGDIVAVAAVSFVLTLLATLYPSYRASRVNPAEALRYE